jgi:hypothetical protein
MPEPFSKAAEVLVKAYTAQALKHETRGDYGTSMALRGLAILVATTDDNATNVEKITKALATIADRLDAICQRLDDLESK